MKKREVVAGERFVGKWDAGTRPKTMTVETLGMVDIRTSATMKAQGILYRRLDAPPDEPLTVRRAEEFYRIFQATTHEQHPSKPPAR